MCCYAYSRPITIDPTFIGASGQPNVPNDDQTNYPVMIAGVYPWLATVANGGLVQQTTGYDIIFASDAAGINILPFERVQYNPATGAVEFHVLIASLSHTTNTVIYVLYGSSCVGDKQNKAGVWVDGYKAVYHFGDGTTLDLTDSSGHGNNGTNNNGATPVAGMLGPGFGGGIALSAGSSQWVSVPSSASIDNINAGTGLVIQAFCKANSLPGAAVLPGIVGKFAAGNASGYGMIEQDNSGVRARAVFTQLDPSAVTKDSGGALIATDSYAFWGIYGGDLDPNLIQFFYHNAVLGSQTAGTGASALANSSGVNLAIGQTVVGSTPFGFWDGVIDEIRIRTKYAGLVGTNAINRVKTEVNNFLYTTTFYTVGSQVVTTSLTISPSGALPNGSVGSAYSQTFAGSGGSGPYTYTVDTGTLPTGLSLNSTTGVLSGTPSVPGTFSFTINAKDATPGCGSASITITMASSAPPSPYTVRTLRYQIPQKRWFPHSYADQIVTHYLDEVYPSSVDNEQLLMLSTGNGFIYRAGGNTDVQDGTHLTQPITSIATTPSMNGGDDRIQKLYVDIMSDVDGTGTLAAYVQYNNQVTTGPNTTFTPAGSRVQFLHSVSSLPNTLQLYRNVNINYQWTGGPAGPGLYTCEPAGYAQPYISQFMDTQIINLAFPGWKHHRRLYAGYISNSALLFTIYTQDGRTYGPYTLPSTGGKFQIVAIMLDQAIKDLAFGYQLDGQGQNFVLFIDSFTIEVKEWTEPSYIPLAVWKT